MKKILKLLICIMILFTLSGCMSKEEKEIVKQIEKDSKKMMLNYLNDNYNVSSLEDLQVRFNDEGDGFGNSFSEITEYATATFTKNGNKHRIICNYNTNKCYDTYAYENKVNPILVKKIEESLKSLGVTQECKPNYVNIIQGKISTFVNNDYYGIFDNNDTVNNYDEVINYYKNIENIRSIGIIEIFYRTDKLISKNLESFKKLSKKLNETISVYNFYNNEEYTNKDIYSEYFLKAPDEDKFDYYSNKVLEANNYYIYWNSEENDSFNQNFTQNEDIEININDNNNYFEEEIEFYSQKYYLYNDKILTINNPKGRKRSVYIKTNNTCANNKVVYKDKYGDLHSTLSEYFFDYNETSQKFAIYCLKQ